MSQVGVSQPSVVLRPPSAHGRSLLALACIAIIGLSIAVVLLATSRSVAPVGVTQAGVSSSAAAADAGARLDHRGLHDAAYLSGLAETGARLDHRGLVRLKPDELGPPSARAQAGAITNLSTQVRPNPDELGPQPSPAQAGPISNYPGHF
jgi:hypothetical protein